MRWLRKLWGGEAPPPTPVLLRVTDPEGQTPLVLDIEARWLPSGRRVDRSVRTAEGLCVVHWRGEEEAVELHVRGVDCEARVTITRDREDRGRVSELRLREVAPLAPPPALEPATLDAEVPTGLSISSV